MKQYTIYLLLLCLMACKHKEEPPAPSVTVTVLYDPTDTRQIQPSAEFSLGLYELDKNKKREAYFKITSTTDMLLNPSKEAYLPTKAATEKSNTNDDPYFREKQVLVFYEQVKQAVKENAALEADTVKYNYSECYRSICREIVLLQKKQYTSSTLIIYSDLQELSDIATTYEQTGIDTAKIKRAFIKSNQLPGNLMGITVYFIFQPKDREEDKKFMLMYALYRQLLEKRGAMVFLQSNNSKINNHE